MQIIGAVAVGSVLCFFVFLARISFIMLLIPPLSPVFIPSMSSMTMAIGVAFPQSILRTLWLLALDDVILSIPDLLRVSIVS